MLVVPTLKGGSKAINLGIDIGMTITDKYPESTVSVILTSNTGKRMTFVKIKIIILAL